MKPLDIAAASSLRKKTPTPQQIKAKHDTIQGAFRTCNEEYLLSEEKGKATHD